MRLQQWKANGWLQAHQTTPAQIADLLAIVDRDLEDSMGELSPDWQFGIGNACKDDADYLDTCRSKRNTAEYDAAGTVSRSEADELRAFTKELRTDVIAWLKANHPTLITAN